MHLCVGVFQHIDHYSRTKAIAEQMVLSANRSSLKGVCNDSKMTELHVKMGYNQNIFASLAWFWTVWMVCDVAIRVSLVQYIGMGFKFLYVLYINRCEASCFFLQL